MFSNREGTYKNSVSENHYYRINKILLTTLHLSPFQQSKYAIINHSITLTIMISFVFFQLTSFLSYQLTMDFLIMLLSYALPSIISILQYRSFHSKPDAVKQILKDIRSSWSDLKNEPERCIMQKYSFSGQRCTIMLLLLAVIFLIIYGFFQFLPSILDMIFPLNETRPRTPYAMTEYFVDQRKYYNLLLSHWLAGTFLSTIVLIATTSLHFVYIEHICGMLSVASYRIRYSTDHYASHNLPKMADRVVLQNITAAVDLHRKALKCSVFLATTFATDFFIFIVLGVLSSSINLMRLLKLTSLLQNINGLALSVVLVVAHFVIMYLEHHYGQKITDHNNKVFYNTYNTRWYAVPVKIQKLFLFIMQNTTKVYILNIGNLIMASVEGFTKLASMSISYFTVMYSLQ